MPISYEERKALIDDLFAHPYMQERFRGILVRFDNVEASIIKLNERIEKLEKPVKVMNK